MKKMITMILILSIASLCFAGGRNEGRQASSRENAIIISVGTTFFNSSLDPVKGGMGYGYQFTNAPLILVNPSSAYIGSMATNWSVSNDSLRYTFNLRRGVRFSDGSSMTAMDVVFTYETVKNNQAENEYVDLTRLASVRAVDDYTVEFTLSSPYSPFLDTTALLGIVPRNAYNKERFDRYPIGTGPWKVVQYDPNQQIILEPNEHYWEGAPSIGRITIVYMENDAALLAARSGQLDIVMVSPNQASERINGMTMHPLETMDIRMISLHVNPEHNRNNIRVGNNVTSDKAVRQALAIGIDRAKIIQNAFNGIGKPAFGFTSNLLWAGGERYADNRKAEAASLLESAGWVYARGDNTVRQKNGVRLEFDIYAAEDRYVLIAALAEDAAALGIKINTHAASWDDINRQAYTSSVIWGWGQYDPMVIYNLFHSRNAYFNSYNNAIGYSNPAVDGLIERALSSASQASAIEYWKQAQRTANEDFPYLYIVNIEHCYFVSNRLDISVNTQIPHPHGHGSPIVCNMKDWKLK